MTKYFATLAFKILGDNLRADYTSLIGILWASNFQVVV